MLEISENIKENMRADMISIAAAAMNSFSLTGANSARPRVIRE